MPEDGLGLPRRVVEVHQLEGAVGLEGTSEVPEDAVDLGDDDLLGETLGDGDGDGEGRGLVRRSWSGGAVGEGDGDGDARGLCVFGGKER